MRRGLQGSMIRQSHLPGVYLCAHCPAHHLGARTVYACCLICHALGSSSTHRKDMKHVTIISRRQNLYYCLMEEERATTERVRTWPGDGEQLQRFYIWVWHSYFFLAKSINCTLQPFGNWGLYFWQLDKKRVGAGIYASLIETWHRCFGATEGLLPRAYSFSCAPPS